MKGVSLYKYKFRESVKFLLLFLLKNNAVECVLL